MSLSKFALCCIAAVAIGASLAATTHEQRVAQSAREVTTPVALIGNPGTSFRNVAVQSPSGTVFGRVIDVAADGNGRAGRIRVAIDGGRSLWLAGHDLVYSRAQNVLIAHRLGQPGFAIADAR